MDVEFNANKLREKIEPRGSSKTHAIIFENPWVFSGPN